ncbi:class I adenylate-forming enzyme family protein [Nocardioides litoris]|uniref:class I adenylate-forming enzyme family protein n=1 Tax=Nocardioides litoris TaxID=1926648 RepID=UPI001476FD7A|nr:AMP-binding protein [Nocardioides litoris]
MTTHQPKDHAAEVRARTLSALVDEHAVVRPDVPAVTAGGRTATFATLRADVDRFAAAIVASGLEPGDRVAVVAANSSAYLAMHFACSRAAVTLVGINWRLSAHEVGAILRDATPRLVLVDHDLRGLLPDSSEVTTVVLDGPEPGLEQWLSAGAGTPAVDRSHEDNILMMLYTTGTTGQPKGVMISERNVNQMLREMSRQWLMRPGMSFVNVLPFFHVSGTGAVFTGLFVGGEVVLLADASAESIARTIHERRITHSALVPTVLTAFVREPSLAQYDLSSLEVLVYGAAPSGGTLVQDAMALLPSCGFTQGYGLTETTGGVSAAPLRRHGDADDRPGTVGQATANYEIRVVDPDSRQEVARGTAGEVWLRGTQNAQGYWNRPEETAANFVDGGWFRTGDVGVLDADGYLYLKDRLKDMIISGGENIYSVEVESALTAHPDIVEAAVYGVPDERWGESVKAVVVRVPGSPLNEDAVLAHARSRLARYKCPKVIEFTDALPKSGSGKIIKHVLRQRDAT